MSDRTRSSCDAIVPLRRHKPLNSFDTFKYVMLAILYT